MKFGPTEAEADANQWHEERQAEHEVNDEFSSCWCCCVYCELNNPHYVDALESWKQHIK